ncbi:DNA adenine methyltransferase YhdJ [Gracilariopsis chorda]|uniref:DNA adenine methyltransferase YhdJ n=1 Tax=Gracilariopsis chorda TaxID=448386 RepID=A0A2V3IWE9_9FLOR|nr:DNA adenine methyltransferase YhdJ [Gracilariopsis chorda]|eukprot:PXF46431.1 DNA adenine methyltransferase YhdJ [Gracilariopsis chorda]
MDQVPPMYNSEMLMWSVKTPDGIYTRKRVRPEQKCRALLKQLICRFSQPGDLVVEMFAGTFSTAMACVELPKHRNFVGCEPDKACFEHARNAAIVRFASIIREGQRDIEKSQELRKMAHCERWPIVIPLHSQWDEAGTPWKLGRKKAMDGWLRELQGRMNLENMKSLLAMEAVQYGLGVGKSTIRHEKAGVGVFATRRIAAGEVVCYFYGTLVYHDLSNQKEVHKTYGEGVMGVTKDRFRKYAV